MTGFGNGKNTKGKTWGSSSLAWHKKLRNFHLMTGHNVNYAATNQKAMDECYIYTGSKLNAKQLLTDYDIVPHPKKINVKMRKKDFIWLSKSRYVMNWKGNVIKNSDLINNENSRKKAIKLVLKSWKKSKSKLRRVNAEKKVRNICHFCCSVYFC